MFREHAKRTFKDEALCIMPRALGLSTLGRQYDIPLMAGLTSRHGRT